MDFSLNSLYYQLGSIDYERVKEISGRIISGTGRIVRLNDDEERGRILGGQRNVEASIIAGAEEGAGPEGESRRSKIQRVEEALEAYARHEGCWFEDLSEFEMFTEGSEAFIYEDPDPSFVLKSALFLDSTPLESLDDRISLFNYLFRETFYELLGFTRDCDGKFRFVLRQPFIIGSNGIDDLPGLAKTMREAGLFATSIPKNFASSNYSVKDVHNLNYIKSNDRVFVIDAIPSLNTPEFGGVRTYLPFQIVLD